MDDDFGELYADVEMQTISAIDALHTEPEDNHATNGAKTTDADEKFVPDSVMEDSDSDDDLNIVLNDDDCDKLPVSGVKRHADGNEKGKNGDFGVEETGLDKTSRREESYTAATPGSFSSMSVLGRGDTEDDDNHKRGGSLVHVANRHATSSSLQHQFGYGFCLPRYRTIFDVNIDAFEEKPWRHPGVDVTDFFNFGFNEDSWKVYCLSLENFRQQSSRLGRIPLYYYSSKLEQSREAEAEHEEAAQEAMNEDVSRVEPSFKCANGGEIPLELPKGRAIQVEDSTDERQPSMDLWCPHFQDSDVIIEITLQDSTLDSSDYAKAEVGNGSKLEVSEPRKLDAEYNTDICFSVSARSDDLSGEHHTRVRNSFTSSSGRSSQQTTASNQTSLEINNYGNSKLSDISGGCPPNMDVCFSEANAEAMEIKIKEHEVPCRNIDQSDPCTAEKETSLENRSNFSPMLCFSECYPEDSSEDSVHSASVEVASPSRSQLLPYDAGLKKSVASCNKSSRSDDPKTKPDDGEGYSIHFSTIRDKQKHGSWRERHSMEQRMLNESNIDTSPISDAEDEYDRKRYTRHRDSVVERRHHCSKYNSITDLRIYPKKCNDATPLSNAQELYDNHYSSVYCGRREESPQGHGSHERENSSHYRERGGPCADSCKRFADNDFLAARTKDRLSFREGSNHFFRKKWNGKELYHDRRVGIDKEDDMDEFWFRGQKLPAEQDSAPRTCMESGRLMSRYSFSSIRKGIKWRRGSDRVQLRKKTGHHYCPLEDKHEFEWLKERYDRSIPFTHCERDMIESYERLPPPVGREVKVSGRKGRNADDAYFHLERSWPMESDHEYQRHMYSESQALASDREPSIPKRRWWSNIVASRTEAYDSRLIENYRRHERRVCYEEDRDNGGFGYYDSADDNEDIVMQNELWRRGHSQRSTFIHWREDKLPVNDRLFAPEVYTFPATKCNQDLDIEEGQIICEEQSVEGANMEEVNASETMMQRSKVKMRTKNHNNASDRTRAEVEYDNKRILETLAKMEKRRERFKDPITKKREPDNTSQPQVELVVDTKETRYQRPARKRRWGVN